MCNAELCRAYRLRNVEKLRQFDKDRYHNDLERKTTTLARVAKSRLENPEQRREWDRRYYEKNKAKFLDHWHQRKARIANAGRVEKIDRDYIISRDGGRCHICGKKPPRSEIELDHLVPIAKGGTHTADNLSVACRHCNRSRNAGRLPAQLLLVG